ncbi:MAG: sporulation transcriptional regulator SpoIIID [Eubacteriales bacterium]
MLYDEQKERCELLAAYMIEHEVTVRAVASIFSVSKSTVHKDITTKLKRTNPVLFEQVKLILDKNKSERHLRGGEATRVKYLKKRREEEKVSSLKTD